jgi:glycerophosphoryl diester phosphodiesterase
MKFNILVISTILGALTHIGSADVPKVINCEGSYNGHLQGTDARGTNIWWSFTKKIVRTDLTGRVLASCDAPSHQGDLCVKGDTLYVAVNRGRFNTEIKGNSFVYSFDAITLKQKKIWNLDMPMGAGGMTWKDDRFYVVGGLTPTRRCNYVHEYDTNFNLIKKHVLNAGYTVLGIQTATFLDGEFLFGIYGGNGNPSGVLRCSPDFKKIRRYTSPGSVGFARINGKTYTGSTPCVENGERTWKGTLTLTDNLLDDRKLFSSTWYEKGVFTDAPINATKLEIGSANGSINIGFGNSWRKRMKELVNKGYNAVFIDFADGYAYPSHSEISAKGAWTNANVKKALEMARKEGIEPIPYMDFTAPRNSWLGAKNLPSASSEALAFCCDLIKDLVVVFDHARYFKIETAGLSDDVVKALNEAIISKGYGSCPWSCSAYPTAENGVTAHRGDSFCFPENSLRAFSGGNASGADWIEIDVRTTSDGKLVLLHNETTKDYCSIDKAVSSSTYAELCELDLAEKFRAKKGLSLQDCPKQEIVLFEDALDLVMKERKARLSIQPKSDCVDEVIKIIRKKNAFGWVGFNDGDIAKMSRVKELEPSIPVFWDRGKSDIDEDIKIAKKYEFECIVPYKKTMTSDKVKKIHDAGFKVGVWTVNNPKEMIQFLDMGVDRIYTDDPTTLKKIVDSRK